jgi:hypothetical protein
MACPIGPSLLLSSSNELLIRKPGRYCRCACQASIVWILLPKVALDRLLIAQAMEEYLSMVNVDTQRVRYLLDLLG